MVYTGIVQAVGKAQFRGFRLLVKGPSGFFNASNKGDSIAINGVCLTLEEALEGDVGTFFVMEESRNLTNLHTSIPTISNDSEFERSASAFVDEEGKSAEINLEHSLRVGDSVGGHTVAGHVSGVAPIVDIKVKEDGSRDVWYDLSAFRPDLQKLVVHKGSICLDGVSLTVAELKRGEHEGKEFLHGRVSLIPYTLSHTTLKNRKIGDVLNVEFDHYSGGKAAGAWEHRSEGEKEKKEEGDEKEKEKSDAWDLDQHFMRQAIAVAEEGGRYTAPPNPWVGCVIVAGGEGYQRVIGKGFHYKAGQPHAEVNALADAKTRGNVDLIKGSTVYVTLEPCHHTGRTPPCDKELVKYNVARVVVAVLDPDTRVSGQGVELLRSAGIEVTVGVCLQEAEASLRPYLHQRRNAKPFVVLKAALSIDGAIGCKDGTSQWITKEPARAHAHKLRAASQAIIVGSGTALIDKPRLTVRGIPGVEVRPLRVVLDTKGKVTEGPLLDTNEGPTLIFSGPNVDESTLQVWTKQGVEHKVAPIGDGGLIDLEFVLTELGKRGILQLLIEGGAKVSSQFLKRNLVNRLVIYQGACIIGGSGNFWSKEGLADTMADVKFWNLESVERLGNDVCMVYDNPN